MNRLTLILNPAAGGGLSAAFQHEVARALAAHGFDVQVRRTSPAPDSARVLAIEASRSCDTVIACGGDGTVHEILQGLAGTSTVLGVLPFGTANALARNLHLPADPLLAVHKLLSYKPQAILLGVRRRMQADAGSP